MTDNEIIKALECCGRSICIECEFDAQCNGFTPISLALSLINRQQAEIERLQHKNSELEAELADLKRDDLPRCKDALRRANEIGIDLEKENQELRAEVAILRACKKQQMDEIKFLSASRLSMWDELNAHRIGYDKGVKEFAERLKEKLGNTDLAIHFIDNLVKEMVGEDK